MLRHVLRQRLLRQATVLSVSALLWPMLCASAPLWAAEHMDADEVRAAATRTDHVDLSGRDMRGDDLSGLDLSGARLAGANLSGAKLHGVKLVGADLTGADLTNADLAFTWIMRANFTRAVLRGVTMRTAVTSLGMDNTPDQAATFAEADFSGARLTVHFSFDHMRGAKFTSADMTVVIANQSMGMLRTEFNSADLDGADFSHAGLGHVAFRFTKLRGAHFNGADLTSADFTGAYLDGADFTGAKLDGATFEAASVNAVVGLGSMTR